MRSNGDKPELGAWRHPEPGLHPALLCSVTLIAIVLAGCAAGSSNSDQRPFFQQEYGLDTHGRKTWFDHFVELDPGGLSTVIAPDYDSHAPLRIAVLPFADRGSANYVVNKIPLTFRNRQQRANWAWTDANRTRRALIGYLAEREFIEANIFQIDAVLKDHGVDSEEKLRQIRPEVLGQWLDVDAVVYGEVTHYDAFYAALLSGWQMAADVKMVSTHDGEMLFAATGSRYDVNFSPAFDPVDIAINSAMALLELRDVNLARAEEEDAREIVLRIPRSARLEDELIEEAQDSEEAQDLKDSKVLTRTPASVPLQPAR
jgi:hypothetical protein